MISTNKLRCGIAAILCGFISLFPFSSIAQNSSRSENTVNGGYLNNLAVVDAKLTAFHKTNNKSLNTPIPEVETSFEGDSELRAKATLGNQQLLYYPNKGQLIDTEGNLIPEVEYVVKQPAMKVYIRKTGLSYVFEKTEELASIKTSPLRNEMEFPEGRGKPADVKVGMHRVDINFIGATAPIEKLESGKSTTTENYYLAQCPDGITVNGFEKVTLKDLYPGIDLILYTKDGNLKYDWLVKTGSDPNQIKMEIEGASHYQIDSKGSLVLETPLGTITETAPEIFQGENQIAGSYKMENREIGFSIADYNSNEDLLIDPLREWATYYGGSGYDGGDGGCATDGSGNVFIEGITSSTNFPISAGAFQDYYNGSNYDVFMVKFNASGSREWATYYGGGFNDYGYGGCATDGSGNIFFHGATGSASFPVSSGAFQPSKGGDDDAYIVKLNGDGIREWATFYGGGNIEGGEGGCATDDAGNVFIHGTTLSTDFPVSAGAFQAASAGSYEAYLVKFDGSGTREWATYCGGDDYDFGRGGCATDNSGNVFIHGATRSNDFPVTTDIYQGTYGESFDAYIVKFDGEGTREWATYYGGIGDDFGSGGCATDGSGNVVVQGYTASPNFPVSADAYQGTKHSESVMYGGYDAYIVKLDASGTRVWATYYGGSSDDYGVGGCAIDPSGNVYIQGFTSSTDFPVSSDAFQGSAGEYDYDAYIVKLNASGSRDWAFDYGGNDSDQSLGGCATDDSGNVFFVGNTSSTNFPVSSGAYQTSNAGSTDAYILKFNGSSIDLLEFTLNEVDGCESMPATIKFYEPGTSNLLFTIQADWNPSPKYALLDPPFGTFDIYIKPFEILQESFLSVEITAGTNTFAMPILRQGDIDNSNGINFLDFSIFSIAFNSNIADSNYNPLVDFNCDGFINFTDVSFLNVNFNQVGDEPPADE